MFDELIFLGSAISLGIIFWIAYSGVKTRNSRPIFKKKVGRMEVGSIRRT